MSKGFRLDDERRIPRDEVSGVVGLDRIIGAKVIVKSVTMQNGWEWSDEDEKRKEYTVSEVGFRVSIDGKCCTIIALSEIEDRTFTLKDIEFIELNEEDE